MLLKMLESDLDYDSQLRINLNSPTERAIQREREREKKCVSLFQTDQNGSIG